MSEKNGVAFPLASVIIRSTDRPTLADALDSVALQTYPNIEVVIVNAKGADHQTVGEWCGHFPVRIIGNSEPLNRARAANIGLNAAKGCYLIFLDDDDLFYPEHIANLVTALQNRPSTRCAYAGVRVDCYVDGQLEMTTAFNEPFDQRRLLGRNFIPIHAMLFEQSLVTIDHCRFDENLEVFEDWDFWIQLSQHSEVSHIDKITALYRNHGYSGFGLKQDESFLRESRSKVYDKWKMLLTGRQLEDLIEYRENLIADLRSQLADKAHRMLSLENRLEQDALASMHREQLLHKKISELHATIHDLFHSTSWKITAPLRFLVRIIRGQHHEAWDSLRHRILPLLKTIYWRLPVRWRNQVLNIAYRIAGPFFSGIGHYEFWRTGSIDFINQLPMNPDGPLVGMVNLSATAPLTTPPPVRIAIHAHIFYADLATEFAKFLDNMPFPYDLFVSTPNEATSQVCKQALSHLPRLGQLTITVVPNRGRDIAPMFCTFGEVLQQYDFIAHIHSKKSLNNLDITHGWREYLLTNLLGSKSQIQKIFTLLTQGKAVGFIYPQNFAKLPYSAYTWLSNQAYGSLWCNKLGITTPRGYFDFPAGSMFWARTEALQPLFNAQIKIEDFPEEAGQNDATLAHCIERLFVLVTRQSGFNTLVLQDLKSMSWSRWHFEQYLLRKQENIHAMLADPMLRIVVFDIFDTLLIRPLLNPEHIKNMVARRVEGETGKLYLELRALAEIQARQKAGRDVGLDAIFEEFSILSRLSPEIVKQLRSLEEAIELEIVAPRPEAIDLLQLSIALGKRVILASDMYLPKSVIETMLKRHGISGWHAFYLSSENGLRKDTGDFYHQLLLQESASPPEVIVIGDNEHSDVQIPGDMGIKSLHLMRPVELARAIPRLGPIIERSLHCTDLNRQLTLGTIVRSNFHPLFFPHFDPSDLVPATPWAIGFTIAGPLVLSFVQWLAEKAAADGIQRLYFLAREGQILKIVYDQWVSHDAHAIPSDYLILSRRAVTVPMITCFDDILQIARVQYFPNHLSEFIQERYGLKLSHEEYENFAQLGLWPKNKLVSVGNENVDHLIPVLQALEARILTNAQIELPGLLTYLNSVGLNATSTSAIVDIGYAATIQGYLNRMVNKTIHGYYLMTSERAQKISAQYGVITQGYFAHHINPEISLPPIFLKSFSLEKLLSSDNAQIVCYQQTDSGDIVPEYRQLTDEERQSIITRAEIRRGMMDFVNQSITIRDKLVSDFKIPSDIATALFDEFIERPSRAEKDILGALVLDDHYCGRGIVS